MGNRIAPAGPERIERIRHGITLQELSSASGVAMTALSAFERGLRALTREQEQRRRDALERLSVRRVEA